MKITVNLVSLLAVLFVSAGANKLPAQSNPPASAATDSNPSQPAEVVKMSSFEVVTTQGKGYVSTLTTPRGTDDSLGYLVALMDRTSGDIALPAAIPAWTGIDYSAGASLTGGKTWMSLAGLTAARFRDYAQTLNLREATLATQYRYVDGAGRPPSR